MPPSLSWFKLLNAVMAVLFVLGAVVQFNDPDPIAWIAMYAAAAVACAVVPKHEPAKYLAALLVAVALGWAAVLLYRTGGQVGPSDLLSSMDVAGGRVELLREGLGLVIIAGWMAVLTRRGFRRRDQIDTVGG